mmetsp:Transcript_19160/g.32540  ORF Transcript_19160/g.32540 Transcript_19160/m.32540 type:complete len:159 (-) Transcript_19160:322-798(-)
MFATIRRTLECLVLGSEHLSTMVTLMQPCAEYMDEFNARYIFTASAILTSTLIDDSGDDIAEIRRLLGLELRLDPVQLARAERFVLGAALRCVYLPLYPSGSSPGFFGRYNMALQPYFRTYAVRDLGLATSGRPSAVSEAPIRRAERARKATPVRSLR